MKSRFAFFGLLFSLLPFILNAQNFWKEVHTGNYSYPTIKTSTGGIVYTTTDSFLVSSSDNGSTWNDIYNFNWFGTVFEATTTGVIYLSADSLRRSYDDGITWTTLSGNNYLAFLWFLESNSDGDLFTETGVLIGSYSFRSKDEGETWVKIGIDQAFMNSVAFHPQGLTYAVYGVNLPSGIVELYSSTNKGDEWIEITTAPENLTAIYCSNNGDLFAAQWLNPALHRSTDGGATWVQVFSQKVNSFAENQEGELFISVDNAGVYRSEDSGITWEDINKGLTLTAVSVLEVDSLGYLYVMAGTDNSTQTTIFRSVEPTIGTVDIKDISFDMSFSLGQNYPNPFNPSTVITYTLPERSFVSISVYDIIGNKLGTFVNELQESGEHNFTFNASGHASGVYFYRINAGEQTAVRKMILHK